MHISRLALVASAALFAACASDTATSPTPPRQIESRLAAVATSPTASVSDANVTMMVAVTSTLTEPVTGGVCAQTIEARAASSTTWSDVTSNTAVCSLLAAQLAPGATLNISAIGDQAKIRTAAGSASSVLLRARHSLAGASSTYTLQSNEITFQLP
jgi:hypothetical protein